MSSYREDLVAHRLSWAAVQAEAAKVELQELRALEVVEEVDGLEAMKRSPLLCCPGKLPSQQWYPKEALVGYLL